MSLQLVRAGEQELAFIMSTERRDGYDAVVGRWEEARHRAALSDGQHAYFVGREDGAAIGFVIFRFWNSPERVTLLKRIAVTEPGGRRGRRLLLAALGAAFGETDVHRIWLGVFPDNERARRAYRACGFSEEGVARGSAFFGGDYRDELILSILRPEWAKGDARSPELLA